MAPLQSNDRMRFRMPDEAIAHAERFDDGTVAVDPGTRVQYRYWAVSVAEAASLQEHGFSLLKMEN